MSQGLLTLVLSYRMQTVWNAVVSATMAAAATKLCQLSTVACE